jgi:hypothetical protein
MIKSGGDKAIQFFKKIAMKKSVAETEEMEEMKSELEEAYSTIKTIKLNYKKLTCSTLNYFTPTKSSKLKT